MKNIQIHCKNNNESKSFELGTSLYDISQNLDLENSDKILGALVNNGVRDLSFEIVKPKEIEFIDYSHPDGKRMYIRSLFFMLFVAAKRRFPNATLKIDHAVPDGYYCELDEEDLPSSLEYVDALTSEMEKMITKNLPFLWHEENLDTVLKRYSSENLEDKIKLFKYSGSFYHTMYSLDDHFNDFYGPLVRTTGIIQGFTIEPFYNGFILKYPTQERKTNMLSDFISQGKLFDILRDHKHRAKLLGVNCVGELNEITRSGNSSEIIKVAEALQEKQIIEIAETISKRSPQPSIILIAGPSSSGKTTFSKRLAIQLKVSGLNPRNISLDSYFVNREDTPKDKDGNYDFESIDAIDIETLNSDLKQLFHGGHIQIPKFDFKEGKRTYDGTTMRMASNDILILEGIHGINPKLTQHIESELTFKIFISALTAISIDNQTPVASTDNRLIRRIIRDYNYRNYTALDTLKQWKSVRSGEDRNIFPYQENVDVMFNSALLHELGILKKYAIPLLKTIPENCPEYIDATRLIKILSLFEEIEGSETPPTSLIREFLGGSSFSY